MTKQTVIVNERRFCSLCGLHFGCKCENLSITQRQRVRSLGDIPSSGSYVIHIHKWADTERKGLKRLDYSCRTENVHVCGTNTVCFKLFISFYRVLVKHDDT
jgi:hypothetical protein